MHETIDPINLEIGERVKEIREQRGWSQKFLAQKADISLQSVLYIEKGKRGLSSHTIRSICLALSVSSEYILFGKSDLNSNRELASRTLAGLSDEECINSLEVIDKVADLLRRYRETMAVHSGKEEVNNCGEYRGE